MRSLLTCILATTVLAGCTSYGDDRHASSTWRHYDYNRPDPNYGGYYADRYYREDSRRYREQKLSRRDRIYRGEDGRFYCRRSDGTTGLIVGAIAGGVLGNIIAPGGSEELGTVLGAIGGGLAGQAIDRNGDRNGGRNRNDDVRCR